MPELQPFIACFPTEKLLTASAGFPEALTGVSLSRAYAGEFLVRDKGEALFRIETDYVDGLGERRTRYEILGFVPDLRSDRKCVVIENVAGAHGRSEGARRMRLPRTLRGIYHDRAETLRPLLEPRHSDDAILRKKSDEMAMKLRVVPIRGPAVEMVRGTLREHSWYFPVPAKTPDGPVMVALANWYSLGTRFDATCGYEGEAAKAAIAMKALREQLREDYSIRDYPFGDEIGQADAMREAVEDLKFESRELPAFAAVSRREGMLYLFFGRKPLPKVKGGFFRLAKAVPPRVRVRTEIVEPVLVAHGLKPCRRRDRGELTIILPASHPDEYPAFATTEYGAMLDLVVEPPPLEDFLFPESSYPRG
ncbi:MAG: hypothetical protein E3J72_02305 [Planctomycetota bacterium]|nr:MAG: hypothetical protein E3J72_02305 [Planctomycetota bacterium]